jgi:tryptophan-rich sensory protein
MLTCLGLLSFNNAAVVTDALFDMNSTSLARPLFRCPHTIFPDKFCILFCLFASSDALAVRNEPLRHVSETNRNHLFEQYA